MDVETVNVSSLMRSLPVSYQLSLNPQGFCGSLGDGDVRTVLARTDSEIFTNLDKLIELFKGRTVTPVVGVHNLAFDIHFLMPYINELAARGYSIDCCFKSSIKPLTITIKDGASPILIFWDTLTFSGKGLARMGEECGCRKKCGDWDYSLERHAKTELTEEEIGYAIADTIVPFMWFKWWGALNPEIPLYALAMPVMTKTSVVRYKCKQMGREVLEFGKPIYERFLECCKAELPKTEQDYNLMIRSTSAGWTFTAGENAGRLCEDVGKYDATSMHPSHMVSHLYPYDFHIIESTDERVEMFESVTTTALEDVLLDWKQPFKCAFNARIMFNGIRPRRGSIFERDDLMLHGSALFEDYETDADCDTESSDLEFNAINSEGFANIAIKPVYSFGKLVSADTCIISLNELNAWVHAQVYEWDSYVVLAMSGTGKFRKPPAYVIKSVEMMLERKQIVKSAMRGAPPRPKPDWVPGDVYNEMLDPSAGGDGSLKAFYKQVKADLNSLYGMFATNEAKQSMVYDNGTFHYDGVRGFENLPGNPKAWYNFGLRIAAWSRVQQCCAMRILTRAGVARSFVNGDTDSFAFRGETDDFWVVHNLAALHASISGAMRQVLCVPSLRGTVYEGLGLYMQDCEPGKYCAVANKRYAYTGEDGSLHVVSAGVPNESVEYALRKELDAGQPFNAAVVYSLGYLANYAQDLSGTTYKDAPEYGECLLEPYSVQDYKGDWYTYPAGTPVGIYLDETEKALGLGYDADYRKCLENGNIPFRDYHTYSKEV